MCAWLFWSVPLCVLVLSLGLEVVLGKSERYWLCCCSSQGSFFFFLSRLALLVRQIREDDAEQWGCSWWWRWWCWVLMLSWTLPLSSSLAHPSQQSASGFPSVFPKLHWLRPLYLRGPGPLALAVTPRWQKNTESWQRCSQEHKARGFCWQCLLFLGYCFVTLKNKNSFRCLSSYFSYCSTRDLDIFFLMFILRNWNKLGKRSHI